VIAEHVDIDLVAASCVLERARHASQDLAERRRLGSGEIGQIRDMPARFEMREPGNWPDLEHRQPP
jgi:hypothetical protein